MEPRGLRVPVVVVQVTKREKTKMEEEAKTGAAARRLTRGKSRSSWARAKREALEQKSQATIAWKANPLNCASLFSVFLYGFCVLFGA